MLSALFLAVALSSAAPAGTPHADPLSGAIRHFDTVQSYRVTIRSTHAEGGEEHVRYYYKKPGFVRIEFIEPHAGAIMIYNPNSRQVRLWPWGIGNFPELGLSPDSTIIRSLSGVSVDHSDVGTLFQNIRTLLERGSIEILGEEARDGRTIQHFIVTGGDGVTVIDVHSSELWLDAESQFPAKLISRDIHGAIIETVVMEELEINGEMPETLFNP
ncbi:MAG: DUF1571 domain-containing protein [Sideroxyarcus sp.]|nr:DUF1571 domain-containing protein [Sideroxyarcus sp.]